MKMKLLSSYCALLVYLRTVTGDGFIAIGDWGSDSREQSDTAEAMASWCRRESCKFIVSTGDNFYPDGVKSPKDPRFETTWRRVYDRPGIDRTTWMITLGNHDYGTKGGEFAQVKFSGEEPRWHLPHLWYQARLVLNGTKVHFVAMDTQAIVQKINDHKGQLEWLERTLKESTARWKIAIGHHPPYSCGKHGPGSAEIRKSVLPLLEKYGVDLFILGHDHNLQHLNASDPRRRTTTTATATAKSNIDHVISGGGGKGLYSKNDGAEKELKKLGQTVRYFGKVHGFVAFDLRNDAMLVRYVTSKPPGQVVHQFTKRKAQS